MLMDMVSGAGHSADGVSAPPNPTAILDLFMNATAGGPSGAGGELQDTLQAFLTSAQSHPQAAALRQSMPPELMQNLQQLWSSVQQDGLMSAVEKAKSGAGLQALAAETLQSFEANGAEEIAAAAAVATDRFGAAVAAAQGGDFNSAIDSVVEVGAAAQRGMATAASSVSSAGDLLSSSSSSVIAASQGGGLETMAAEARAAAQHGMATAASSVSSAGDLLSSPSSAAGASAVVEQIKTAITSAGEQLAVVSGGTDGAVAELAKAGGDCIVAVAPVLPPSTY
jgi:hypothetical protein